jgi:ABC-type multidrug transport system fused ATPase/permease subunit
MNNLKKVFYLLSSKEKYFLIIILFLNLIGIFLETLSFAIIIPVFNLIFIEPKKTDLFVNFFLYDYFKNNLDSENFKILVLVIMLTMFAFKNIFLIFINYISIKFYNLFQLRLSNNLFELYLKQNYSFFLSDKSNFLIRKVINDTMGVKTYLNLSLNSVIDFLLVFAFSFVLLYMSYQIFIFTFILFTISVSIYFYYFKNKIINWSYLYQNNLGILQNTIIEGTRGIKDLIIYNLINSFLKKFLLSNKKTFLSFFKIDFINNVQRFWMEIVAILAMTLPLIFFLFLDKDVKELIPIFALFFLGLFKIIPTFNRLIQAYQIQKFNRPSLDIIYQQFLDLKSENESITEIKFKNCLQFRNVGHTYESNKYEVFSDLNFQITKGESIAIIGPNGSGKSSLLNLISGLIKPCKGSILIDNTIELHKVKKSWIEKISYVQQNIFLVNSSIKQNITFEEDKNIDLNRYNKVLEMMNLEIIFHNLPKKLDTIVGNEGLNLSGGQKQLISIARALYKDSEIIIFDEANSALDKECTEVLEKIIFELKGKKTIIFVTHDMLLLKNSFDKIYKLNSGEIILQ